MTSQSNTPTVSVVIPAYNAEAYLAEAIESAASQSNVDAEIILVDDGSTDATSEIAMRFKGVLRYERRENGGVAAALNTGIDLARGKYIALLAADDVMGKGALALRSELLDRYPDATFAHGGAYEIDESGKPLRLRGKLAAAPILQGSDEAFSNLLRGNHVICSTVMARKSALVDLGGFDQTLVPGEDWAAWLYMAAHGDVVYTPTPVALYRIHSASITARMDLEDYERAHERILDTLFSGDRLGRQAVRKREAYAAHHRRMALTSAYLRQRRAYIRHAKQALRMRPGLLTERDTWSTAYFGVRLLVPDRVLRIGSFIVRAWTKRYVPGVGKQGASVERP